MIGEHEQDIDERLKRIESQFEHERLERIRRQYQGERSMMAMVAPIILFFVGVLLFAVWEGIRYALGIEEL